MSHKSSNHTRSATLTQPTKHAKPLDSTEPDLPPRQAPEVAAAIYYFGAFELSATTISKLVLSKYPDAKNVRAEDCYNRVVWLSDELARKGLPSIKISVGSAVKDAVPYIEDVNPITQIDDECEKILQRDAPSLLPQIKDQNNIVRTTIMIAFSEKDHSEYEKFKKMADSISRPRPLPQDNPLPPGALAYEGYNAFLGYNTPCPSKY